MKLELTLVLPVHNEGESIRKTLLEIDSKVPSTVELKIYVSEDGSSDNTRDEVQRAAEMVQNSVITIAPPAERLGYSRGVLRGIKDCNTDLIGFMDADGQYDPADLGSLLSKVKSQEIVVGYRNPRNDSHTRIIFSKSFGLAYRFFGGPTRRDPSSPFVVCFHKDIKFLADTSPKLDFGFWWEFQTRIGKSGLRVTEIPINHRVRFAGETQVYSLKKIPRIVATHLIGLYRLRKELNRAT